MLSELALGNLTCSRQSKRSWVKVPHANNYGVVACTCLGTEIKRKPQGTPIAKGSYTDPDWIYGSSECDTERVGGRKGARSLTNS